MNVGKFWVLGAVNFRKLHMNSRVVCFVFVGVVYVISKAIH